MEIERATFFFLYAEWNVFLDGNISCDKRNKYIYVYLSVIFFPCFLPLLCLIYSVEHIVEFHTINGRAFRFFLVFLSVCVCVALYTHIYSIFPLQFLANFPFLHKTKIHIRNFTHRSTFVVLFSNFSFIQFFSSDVLFYVSLSSFSQYLLGGCCWCYCNSFDDIAAEAAFRFTQ